MSTPCAEPAARPVFDIAAWLDGCETDLVHPGVVEQRLRNAGWAPMAAAGTAATYRRRFNEHALGYSALLIATGVAALGLGSTAHTVIAALTRPVDRHGLARWLTIFICAFPFAVWAHCWAAGVDHDDPVAVWSVPRRTLAQILLWASGIVGIGRLMIYVGQLVGVLVATRPSSGDAVLEGALNVAVVVGIALPLGLWAFGFLHRFDGEDPTAPTAHRRTAGPRS
jgi:hypothetical protein